MPSPKTGKTRKKVFSLAIPPEHSPARALPLAGGGLPPRATRRPKTRAAVEKKINSFRLMLDPRTRRNAVIGRFAGIFARFPPEKKVEKKSEKGVAIRARSGIYRRRRAAGKAPKSVAAQRETRESGKAFRPA